MGIQTQPQTQPQPRADAPTFPPGAVVPEFLSGRPNQGPSLKNPVMGAPPYNGATGPASRK